MESQSPGPPAIDDRAQLRQVSSAAVRREEIYVHLQRLFVQNPYDTLEMSRSNRAQRRPKGLHKPPGGAEWIAVSCLRCWPRCLSLLVRPVRHPSADRDRT